MMLFSGIYVLLCVINLSKLLSPVIRGSSAQVGYTYAAECLLR